MNTVNLKLSIKPQDRYITYLRIVSSVLPEPLTDSEMQILNAFHQISNGDITTESRKEVCLHRKITNLNLNNFITRLRKKEFVYVNDEGIETINRNFNIDTAKEESILGLFIQMISKK